MRHVRILLYCHNALGLGHLVRTGAIASAIRREDPSADVLVITGAQMTVPGLFPQNVAYIKLPSAHLSAKDGQISAAAAHLSLPWEDLRLLRSEIIKAVIARFRPDACVVDHNPAGFYGELEPAISSYRDLCPNGKLVLGMRGIAYGGRDDEEYLTKYATYLREVYDGILVYVDPCVVNVGAHMPAEIACKVQHVGYVTRIHSEGEARSRNRTPSANPVIVVAAGSGSVGFSMIRKVVEAVGAGAEPNWRITVCTGPYMNDDDVAALRTHINRLPQTIDILRVASDIDDLLSSSDLYIGQAGYNTLVELMATGCPAIVVPYETLHGEQLAHASLLSQLGVVTVIRESDLTVEHLLRTIRGKLTSVSRGPLSCVDLGGAARAAQCILRFAAAGAESSQSTEKVEKACERSA